MLDVTVVILTYNEILHIERCLQNVTPWAKRIVVVDCHSTDGTQDVCTKYGAEVIEHDWPGNQAAQFNWTLDNVQIDTEWVFRLDADEYLTNELIEEMQAKLPSMSPETSAVVLPLGRAFMGHILKHGIVNGIEMVRIFRTGKARYETRLMDEHLLILEGETTKFNGKFIDDNRLPVRQFIDKHNNYSTREMVTLLDAEYGLFDLYETDGPADYAEEVSAKRQQKAKYARLPLFHRAIWYFLYRYVIKLGFLDGKEGFLWDFFQGLWYRMLVDAKVYEVKKACGADKDKIRKYLKEKYNTEL